MITKLAMLGPFHPINIAIMVGIFLLGYFVGDFFFDA